VINTPAASDPLDRSHRLVIFASSLGTVFEWYDFYIYGTLAVFFGKLFFPPGSETAGFLSSLALFGVGFSVRPFGALVFGRIGDLVGRKYTFLVTIIVMGSATALVGAATYVAEHAPAGKRGAYTSWIQTTATLGFFLSLAVIYGLRQLMTPASFAAWGWRIPFLVSIVLLAISVYIRLKLQESPVFAEMKAQGRSSKAPLTESFARWDNGHLVLRALFGATAGQGVVWYGGQFYALYFLSTTLKVDYANAYLLVAIALLIGTPFFLLFGRLSDRIGRKRIMLTGFALAAFTYVPIFGGLTRAANPALAGAMERAPVVVHTTGYHNTVELTVAAVFDALGKITMISARKPPSEIDRARAYLNARGIPFTLAPTRPEAPLVLDVGGQSAVTGFDEKAFLVELFPTRIRYTSMSLPYHIGNGWFGGFLPLIAASIVVFTGDIYAGLWYPIAVALMSLLVGWLALPETKDNDINA
jgi:MFS family permease